MPEEGRADAQHGAGHHHQPRAHTAIAGETATFTVVASGPELSYQWSKDGVAIEGATSASYTTPALVLGDDGAEYRATVRNEGGEVTSAPAALTVLPAGTFMVYRDGAVGSGWEPQVWTACGTGNPSMTAPFAGQTTASFDLSCAPGGWTAGTFGHWSGKFDLASYDLLTFEIGSTSDAGMAQLGVWFDNDQAVDLGTVTAGRLNRVTVRLSAVGLTGGQLNQFGWFFRDGRAGPKFHVNNVAFTNEDRPTSPPVVSGLTVTQVADYGATLTFTTDRATTGVVSAQTEGGPVLTAGTPQGTAHTVTLDSLQPSTLYHVTVVATDTWGNASAPATVDLTTTAPDTTPDITVTLDPAHPAPISPWIYGINGIEAADVPLLTLERSGGNRLTAYNWENNASNAGSDYRYHSDDYLLNGNSTPAEYARRVIASARGRGAASLVTFQLQGWVAADKDGDVDMSQPLATRLATRFKQVVPKKSTVSDAPFTATPDTSDAYVFMDEFAWTLDQLFPGADVFGASTALPTFASLDNEPELWSSTHEEIQGPTRVTADELIAKTVAMTRALKDQFPGIKIFGPAHYGFMGLWRWQDDPTLGGGTNWFTDKYLRELKAASDAAGRRLLDVYDFHWYAEVYDAERTRITAISGTDLTDAQVQLIVQSPRALWDPTFLETGNSNAWVQGTLGGPIQILPRIQEKIDASFPGTKIAITEYESGGWNHIAGTIAQADNLGVFGAQGVFAANFWPPSGTHDYALAGFRAFRGFDGATASFGDTSIPATSSDVSQVAVYASEDSGAAGRRVLVAINRSSGTRRVSIAGQTFAGTATLYRMTAASARAQVNARRRVAPVLVGTQPVSGTSMFVALPPLSVTTIEIE
ncbi:MAG TPA: glycoside hydrolase family 44 protein [Anaeromyxobacter sp.]|nr:glycoside hydrolase family 44 protein [Anaeromyxobacter sp.]